MEILFSLFAGYVMLWVFLAAVVENVLANGLNNSVGIGSLIIAYLVGFGGICLLGWDLGNEVRSIILPAFIVVFGMSIYADVIGSTFPEWYGAMLFAYGGLAFGITVLVMLISILRGGLIAVFGKNLTTGIRVFRLLFHLYRAKVLRPIHAGIGAGRFPLTVILVLGVLGIINYTPMIAHLRDALALMVIITGSHLLVLEFDLSRSNSDLLTDSKYNEAIRNLERTRMRIMRVPSRLLNGLFDLGNQIISIAFRIPNRSICMIRGKMKQLRELK